MSHSAKEATAKKLKRNIYHELTENPQEGVTVNAAFRYSTWLCEALAEKFPNALVGHVEGESYVTVLLSGDEGTKFMEEYRRSLKPAWER